MTDKPFLDTNVLVYAFGDDDGRKRRALLCLAEGGVVSVHVLSEFVDVARRKLRRDWGAIIRAVDELERLLDPPVPVTIEAHRGALDLSRRHGFRIYDSLVLSTARLAGCRTLLSEDLSHGQIIDGVRIENPFLT